MKKKIMARLVPNDNGGYAEMYTFRFYSGVVIKPGINQDLNALLVKAKKNYSSEDSGDPL